MTDKIKVPRIASEYINVFRPEGAPYRGPDGEQLRSGQWYDCWVPNDHTFTQGTDGAWHIFGITHPLTSATRLHEGEVELFHAEAPNDAFRKEIEKASFVDKGNILPPSERPGEIKEIHSPFIVQRYDIYHMIYGPSPFRLATSSNLRHWNPSRELFCDADGGRDPQILSQDGMYYLYYCSGNEVRVRESADLIAWSSSRTILVMEEGVSPESPFMLRFEDTFYLFVCTWDGHWDHETVSQAYQHKTLVFVGGNPFDFTGSPVTVIDAHAPEIFRCGGRYYISSAEWPSRGINVAKLDFEPR